MKGESLYAELRSGVVIEVIRLKAIRIVAPSVTLKKRNDLNKCKSLTLNIVDTASDNGDSLLRSQLGVRESGGFEAGKIWQ